MAAFGLRTAVLAATVVTGCASGPSQLYEGPARSRGEIALIAQARGSKARVFAVDSARTTGDSWILPGPHVVWISFQVVRHGGDLTYTVWTYCQMAFEASAGGTYLVESFASQELAKGSSVKTALGARIKDARGSVVAFPRACSGDRPKLP